MICYFLFNDRDSVVRPHQSDPLLHRVDHHQERILGGAVRQSVLLPYRMVQPDAERVRPDGGGHATYVSIFFIYNNNF